MNAKLIGSRGRRGTAQSDRAGDGRGKSGLLLTEPLTVSAAACGDEPLVQQFLQQAGWPVNTSDYLTQLEQPGYETSRRLLLRRGDRLLGHLRRSQRPTWLAQQWVGLTQLHEWSIDPRLDADSARSLWEVAESTALAEGNWGLIAALRRDADVLPRGCVPLPVAPWHHVRPAALLAQLSEAAAAADRATALLPQYSKPRIRVRLWRQVEQVPLRRLYDQFREGVWGICQRSDEYWRWLTARRGFHQIYLAVEGDRDTGFHDPQCRIHGYAVVRGGEVVEWIVGSRRVGEALLSRIARDALEHDIVALRLAQPLGTAAAVAATEAFLDRCSTTVPAPLQWRLKVFHPLRFLDRIRPLLAERAEKTGCKPGSELGLDVDGHRFQLVVDTRSVRLQPGKLGRSHVSMSCAQFLKLVLGTVSAEHLIDDGALRPSTQLAQRMVIGLFPRHRWWLSSWDELPAIE